MDIKFSKDHLSEIIQSGRFLGKMIGNTIDKMVANIGRKSLLDFGVPLAKDNLPQLSTNATLSVIDNSERKISRRGAIRAGKGFTLFMSNKDMNDIIRIIKSLENSGVLFDGITEAVKHEIKKNKKVKFSLVC